MAKLYIRTTILLVIALTLLIPVLGGASRDQVMYSDQVAVLMYHHIDDNATSSSTITTQLFRDQLHYLQQKGYQFINLQQFESFLNGGTVPVNAVLVTFDDGYESFYRHAYPIMTQLEVPGVNFIITETLDGPRNWNIPFMTRNEIAEIANNAPNINFQCHTHTLHNKTTDGHPYLTHKLTDNGVQETDAQWKQRIVNDTRMCIQQMSDIHPEPVTYLAYPYGAFDKHSAAWLREAGIQYAFTIVPEMTTRNVDRMQIPRINAGSPHIKPQNLHHTILRRVEAVDH